ncbi:MAG: YitT family protein [Clostridia bacterium]|nr:YitT family protein [Clostridia bacterium]
MMKNRKEPLIKDFFKRIPFIALGSLILAIGINIFITPHHLLSGGVSGLALLAYYITGIAPGLMIIALNIPVFYLGFKKVDLEFVLISMMGMLMFSFLLSLTKPLQSYLYVEDLLASCILGGVLNGIGNGIIFRQRASLGGSDIVSIVLKQKYSIEIYKLMFGINIVVVSIGTFINSLELAVYTLISMYIGSSVLNLILDGLDRKKMLLIVTDQGRACADAMMANTRRGITILSGEGAYTGAERQVLYCTVTSRQLASMKNTIIATDPHAFISVVDVSEVQGKGFKQSAF